ncbi:homocysteine S-methyltransferase family protein [Oscillospiraceae bacterium WX1]
MLNELLQRDFIYLDGAMGSLLQSKGLKGGKRPETMNMTAPEAVYEIHKQYADAGSDILFANTFGANERAMRSTGYSVSEIITEAIGIAKKAGGGKTLTALDVGPTGMFIKPFGKLTFEESYALYREEAIAGEAAGADLAAIETMSDLLEMKAAILAVRENTKLPIFATMTFDKRGRTFTGCRPESFAVMAERLGVTAVGINCSLSPKDIYPAAEKIARMTALPLIVKPNAGLPNGLTRKYDTDAKDFAEQMAMYAALGVKIVGGCCGTTPEYIDALRRVYASLKPQVFQKETGIFICAPMHTESLDDYTFERPQVGEGMVPESTVNMALEQDDNGSRIIMVCLPKSPEQALDALRAVVEQCDKPLHLISDSTEALSAALREVPGIAAVTSPKGNTAALSNAETRFGAVILQ